MGRFFGSEIKKSPVQLSTTTVRLPSGSFLKLGGQGFTLLSDLEASISASGLGGLEAGSVVPIHGIMFLFVVRVGDTNYLTISDSNTSTYSQNSFVGFIQINSLFIFDVFRFDTQTPSSADADFAPASTGGFNVGSNIYYSIYSRMGSRLFLKVAAQAGTVAGSTAQWSLPNLLTVSNLITPGSGLYGVVGQFYRKINTTVVNSVICRATETSVKFGIHNATSNNVDNAINGDGLLANSEDFYFTADLPIEGWYDNLQDLLG